MVFLKNFNAENQMVSSSGLSSGGSHAEDALAAGGKALEKAVPGSLLGLYFAYVGARNYLAFAQKRMRCSWYTLPTAAMPTTCCT